MQDSAANPTEVTHLSDLLKTVGQECTSLQAEFQRNFGPRAAGASGPVSGAMLPSDRANLPAAQVLPTDGTGQLLNGQSGAVGPNLDPSAAVFQPTGGVLPDGIADMDPADVHVSVGPGPMTMQEYKVMLDPNHVADHQWEREEMQKEKDELLQRIE